MSKTFIRILIFLVIGLVVYSFLASGWSSKLNPFGLFSRSVQETQDTALKKAKQSVKLMNEKNRQLEQDIAGLEPGVAPSHVPDNPAPEPTNTQPQQAHEIIAGKTKDAAQTINRNYREIERTDAVLNTPSPTQ